MKLVAPVLLAAFFVLGTCHYPPSKPEQTRTVKILPGVRYVPGMVKYPYRGLMTPTAIVLHHTRGKLFYDTLRSMELRGQAVHLIIDEDGTAYQLMDHIEEIGRAARSLDDHAIHIALIAKTEADMLRNNAQMQKTVKVIQTIVGQYPIPLNNSDVSDMRGIFSHTQVKYRFGGFLPNDVPEPGDEVMRILFRQLGGTYTEEKDWKDRGGRDWLVIAENASSSTPAPEFTKGRGLTSRPKIQIPSLLKDHKGYAIEERRIQYIDRGSIEVKGVVLHFTATRDYSTTIRVLEQRRLWSSIVVDTDGSGYQILDALEDKPAAASGTNDHCVQIEIVGRGEPDLLANRKQKKKVIQIVRDLCARYAIPNDNLDIESNRGIFSHGQAKKRFGHSAWLTGDDFDPGEAYMKEIIEGIGGRYYPEREWKDRTSDTWVFLFDTWTP